MGLNKSKGNMYPWIDYTWGTIKGKCYHNCSYCYMKRWGNLKDVRFDEKELKEFDRDMKKHGENQFIFVVSGNDLFANDINHDWIMQTLIQCKKYDNTYLFQTKNTENLEAYFFDLPKKSVVCTTIETNRWYPEHMGDAPIPEKRAFWLNELAHHGLKTYVTIEPIMDFDLKEMIHLIETCLPEQVNIGANTSYKIKLPEPPKEKILELITELEKFTKVKLKKNLNRLTKK